MASNKLEFQDIYKEFYERIHRYLERMVGGSEAEDLTQEVFMKVNKALEGFKAESRLSTWVYRIATNAALDKMRSRTFREGRGEMPLSDAHEEAEGENTRILIAETSLSAEREAIKSEMNECIREYIDKLPEDYRAVIILSELKDLQNQQIADILGISLDAVKIRLHRARVKLKAEFEAACNFYHDEDGQFACDRKNKPKEPE